MTFLRQDSNILFHSLHTQLGIKTLSRWLNGEQVYGQVDVEACKCTSIYHQLHSDSSTCLVSFLLYLTALGFLLTVVNVRSPILILYWDPNSAVHNIHWRTPRLSYSAIWQPLTTFYILLEGWWRSCLQIAAGINWYTLLATYLIDLSSQGDVSYYWRGAELPYLPD